MPAAKGHKKAGGRKKGTPNKATAQMQTLRDSFTSVYWEVGGPAWLKRFARAYPKEFATLLTRLLPHEHNVSGANGGPIITQVVLKDE